MSCLSSIRTCDLNQELEDRGIDVPKFASKAWKMRMLDDLTHEVSQAARPGHAPPAAAGRLRPCVPCCMQEETKELLSIAEAVR